MKDPMEKFTMAPSSDFFHTPTVPYDPAVDEYVHIGNMMMPAYFSGWMEESMSWKETCYIHTGLSMRSFWLSIKGPDAERLLTENSVSDFSTMKIGKARHTIFCNDYGHIMGHGATLRIAQDEFQNYGCDQSIMYLTTMKDYDVEPAVPDHKLFIFQIGGPRSLEVIEHACEQDLHDLKFLNFTQAKIAGHAVRILRIGMAGTLAYEVHGPIAESEEIYRKIMEAGQSYGIKRMGEFFTTYACQHTENGFPQSFLHFHQAFREDPEFYKWYRQNIFPDHPGIKQIWDAANDVCDYDGTLGDCLADYYRNPIELGWGHMINWEHDFVGKEALQKILEEGPRKPVTLFWNAEDVLDVEASYLREGTPYKFIEYPRDMDNWANFQLRVENKDGQTVGVTSFRTYSLYQRAHISLCCIDSEYAEEGNEIIVVWGDRDKYPIKRIRATVKKFPTLDLPRNEHYNIEAIPHYAVP